MTKEELFEEAYARLDRASEKEVYYRAETLLREYIARAYDIGHAQGRLDSLYGGKSDE